MIGTIVSEETAKEMGSTLTHLSRISQIDLRKYFQRIRTGTKIDSFESLDLVVSMVTVLQYCFVADYDRGKRLSTEFSGWMELENMNRHTGQVSPLIDATEPMRERLNRAIALYAEN